MSWNAPFPTELRQAIERQAQRVPLRELSRAAAALIQEYRETGQAPLSTEAQRIAYVVTRMPATFGAISAVVREARARIPNIETALDLGAGPGTAAWALRDLKTLTLVEGNRDLIALGRTLGTPGEWLEVDLRSAADLPTRDLVICAYSMGELDEATRLRVIQLSWKAARKAVAVVEPGTPQGFARILGLRDALIASGGLIVAPCPHNASCPMPPDDWCHFSQRIERSALHRQVKGGALGYEDEKFSYVVAAKSPSTTPLMPRVLRHPRVHTGYIQLDLCTAVGLKNATVTRRQRETYKQARQVHWGDVIDIQDIAEKDQIR